MGIPCCVETKVHGTAESGKKLTAITTDKRAQRVATFARSPSLTNEEKVQLINIERSRKPISPFLSPSTDRLDHYREVTFHIPDDDAYFVPPEGAVQVRSFDAANVVPPPIITCETSDKALHSAERRSSCLRRRSTTPSATSEEALGISQQDTDGSPTAPPNIPFILTTTEAEESLNGSSTLHSLVEDSNGRGIAHGGATSGGSSTERDENRCGSKPDVIEGELDRSFSRSSSRVTFSIA